MGEGHPLCVCVCAPWPRSRVPAGHAAPPRRERGMEGKGVVWDTAEERGEGMHSRSRWAAPPSPSPSGATDIGTWCRKKDRFLIKVHFW